MVGADGLRSAAEFGARSGRRNLRHRLAAAHQRPGIALYPRARLDRDRPPVNMDWSSRISPEVSRTSAATTPPSDSFTTSPGTSPTAGTIRQVPSRRTDAFSASRDLECGKGCLGAPLLEQSEYGIEHQQTGDDRGLDILAEHQLEHDRSLDIHGTGAQNFSSARRNGCSAVSGIAFGPDQIRAVRSGDEDVGGDGRGAGLWDAGGDQRIVKGAFAVIVGLAQTSPTATAAAAELEAQGFRVLAVAAGPPAAMRLAGLIALSDPPRRDSAALVSELHGLGVRTVMVTGDAPATASIVAHAVGLDGAVCPPGRIPDGIRPEKFAVFAGVLPEG